MDESSLLDSLCLPGEEYRGRPVHRNRDVRVISDDSDDPHVSVAALSVTGGRACALQPGRVCHAARARRCSAKCDVPSKPRTLEFDGICRSKNKNPVLGNISKKDRS